MPSSVLSMASAKSAIVTADSPVRAAPSAASLTRFFRSAPTRPGVWPATWSRSTSGARGTLRVWIRRIAARPRRSGGCTVTRRSNRPGRSSAGSSTSARFVAASTITPSRESKPSISVRIWFRVCSCSSLPPNRMAAERLRPIASSSSMKMIDGAAAFALVKRSRTREAPTPTIASTNSDAAMLKNGTFASPATARASNVLPVPGAPIKSTPLGIVPPRR